MSRNILGLVGAIGLAAALASQVWAAAPVKPPAIEPAPGIILVQLAETPVSAMPPQMAHAYIVGIQEELAVHGYRPGPADGSLGALTVHAIRSYQRDAGLKVNGVASRELLDHLKFAIPKVMASAPHGGQMMAMSPDMVKRAQAALNAKGYSAGPVDGVIGPRTRGAIRRFQADVGLPETGALDEDVLALLEQ